MRKIQLLLVEDSGLLKDGFVRMLRKEPDFKVSPPAGISTNLGADIKVETGRGACRIKIATFKQLAVGGENKDGDFGS